MSAIHDAETFLHDLNDPQLEAVRHRGAPLLILAGAGSGKTRVITVKIAYLIRERGVSPFSILAVTFTNKAANEMRIRAAGLEPSAADVVIRTFHSFGAWFLRRNCHAIGMDSNFTIYDDDDMVSLLRAIYSDRNRSHLSPYARMISRAKDYLLGPDDDLEIVSEDPDFPEIYSAYEKRLREIGNADFGDLICLPVRILREHSEIRERTRDRFRVIMVDEYQDSNVAQHQLLRELYREDSYLCVVGDDDQSIYRFRGAEVRNILKFGDDFPGTQIVRLEENYRSTPSILNLASSVVACNTGRLGKTLWTRRPDGPEPVLMYLDDEDEEARYCARLLSADNYGRTAILYRTNAQSRLFETLFLRANVPYRIVGTLRFYEREEVKDTLAYLRLVANPRDEVSFRRIINKPSRGLGNASVDRIVSHASEARGNLLDAARFAAPGLGKRQAKSTAEFLELYRELTLLLDRSTLAEFVEQLIETSGLHYYHEHQDETAGSQKLENLEELVNAASLYGKGREGLQEFLEGIELDSARQSDDEQDPNRVTLITMHNTKGLEFDRVIITGLEEGLFPRGSDESVDELEEERRLFYVAITRARNELFLTSCASRVVHGRRMILQPSRFLGEIPEELVERQGRRPQPGFSSDAMNGWNSNTFRRQPEWEEDIDPEVWTSRAVVQSDSDRSADPESAYPRGSHVYHDQYGAGIVVKQWRAGAEEVVLIQFESGRTARFLPRYTPLERISGDE
ncbi:MAG TPA: UvrD-helicase domain-containing protein [Spirochaetia bacterium]|nr:UvrD-helicase domain-containing protein [Spirochaetia bacterium]